MPDNGPSNKAEEPLISPWQTVANVGSIDADEVHVWLLRIEDRLRSFVETSLSRTESERANGFRFRNHQTQFVVSRGALRSLLGKYLGQPAEDIEIIYTELGKPYISEHSQPTVHFNISHSGEYAVLAFSLAQTLGIDIEKHDPDAIDEGLLRQCLTASEQLRYEQSLPCEKTAFFFDSWVRKEAYMKLIGDGLTIPPSELSLSPTRPILENVRGLNIYYSPMPIVNGFSSALATREAPGKVRYYRLGSNLLK